MTRIPSGHPEGYLEGFANIYREIASAVRAARSGAAADAQVLFPTGEDGASGMRFIEATVASSAAGATWVRL
jgi:predicted dehydrogenase